jgi:cytochrome c biogenesis protein CcmG, thiol:disulfide interchange protein DsbE
MTRSLILSITTLFLIAFTNGKPFPSATVKTLQGKTVNVKDYVGNGKITVVSFWATWCSPCKRELDAFKDLYPAWQKDYGVDIVAITIDDARGMAKVPGMVKSKGWDYTILSDSNGKLQQSLNFQTIPQTFLVDAAGNIVASHNGYNPGDEFELEEKIKKLAKK